MIVVRLWGGLGNQMFQYACAYALSKKNNDEVILDTRFFTEEYLRSNPHFTKQKLNILNFPVDFTRRINQKSELKFINLLQNRTISRIIRIPPKFSCKADHGLQYIKETRLEYLSYINNEKFKDIYLDGYWQTEMYFLDSRTDLVRQFTLNSKMAHDYAIKEMLQDYNSVAVHLRMGDYSTSKKRTTHYNYIINPLYYKNAINYINEQVYSPRFYIFSNNITKAKELLGESSEFIYVNEDRRMSDLDEFEIMSLCKHHIISNSTFSWWAAWIAEQRDAINIGPDIKFGNSKILPENWIKVSVPEC